MRATRPLARGVSVSLVGLALAVSVAASPSRSRGQRGPGDVVRIDDDDIGGVVTGPNGPEAGVWVIAETTDLPTKFVKIVVTDDRGRYVVPDLPKATYSVWVRGYGLVDSSKARTAPGKIVDLKCVVGPDGGTAGECERAVD